ncbi:MAG TPA: alanine racemase [Terrimicrobiaceae bacterium]|nr:alanine racemase [Terrimicrobiaceae bacterium]
MNIPSDLRTWAEIDLSAIRKNVQAVRRRTPPGTGIIAVVKANAYGHGASEVAAALAADVEMFAVANAAEAREIAGHNRDILLLSPSLPAERETVVAGGFVATVSSASEAAGYAGGRVCFKIDTGMGRVGCWHEQAVAELRATAALPDVAVHSICTHLPSADEDDAFTRGQIARFESLAGELRAEAPGCKIHLLNTPGILRYPSHAADFVRPGLMLYGCACPEEYQSELIPALTWKTRIILIREVGPDRGISYGRTYITRSHSRIASLAVGYADGFPRQASGRGAHVLIGGKRCPVLGRVTMDQILVDVSGVPGAQPGDEAVLVGRQGTAEISVRELAGQAGTIPWDILTGLGRRVRRCYF